MAMDTFVHEQRQQNYQNKTRTAEDAIKDIEIDDDDVINMSELEELMEDLSMEEEIDDEISFG